MQQATLNKLLFELSVNSRIKRKELAKKLNKSPQLISYTLDNLEKDNKIKYISIVDPARFNYNGITVFVLFKNNNKNRKKQFFEKIESNPYITFIVELENYADVLINYTTSNLSQFNKQLMQIEDEFSDFIKVLSIYPIIVKHLFSRNYLSKNKINEDIVVLGDREEAILNTYERDILKKLIINPLYKIVNLSEDLGINVRTVIKAIKNLRDYKVLRKFSIDLDYEKLNIKSSFVLIKLENIKKTMDKIVAFSKYHPNIISLTKLIGDYNILLHVESFDNINLVIKELREEFNFYEYKVFDILSIKKHTLVPV